MKNNRYEEFSEFKILQMFMKVNGEEHFTQCGAVGSAEETLEAQTVVKKYGGVIGKQRTIGTGAGTLKLSLHMSYERYNEVFGKKNKKFIEGVMVYGRDSLHKVFALTLLIADEDGDKKLKAYPNCTITSAPSGKVENGGEEVPEIELEIAIMPDENNNAMYEALYDKLAEEVREKWMEDFSVSLIQIPEA